MTLTTDGIVIREQSTGESDRIITILTRTNGVIKCFANNSKSIKNKNTAATGLLCYSDFTLSQTKNGTYIVREATAKQVFFSLREDIVKLSLAQYFAELTYELSPVEDSGEEFLSLLLNSIHLILNDKYSLLHIKAVTELRLMCLSGFAPSLISCRKCGAYESERMYFDVLTGELYCNNCFAQNKSFAVSLGVIAAMRHICFSEKNKIYSFSLSEESLSDLCFLTERYLKNVTMKRFKTLDFFKSISGEL